MNRRTHNGADDPIPQAAARWTVRRDRGLSAAESIEYELWLAVDPRHADAMRRAGGAWARLDRIPEHVAQPALAAGRRRRRWWRAAVTAGSLAAAAVVPVFWATWPAGAGSGTLSAPAVAVSLQAAGPRLVTLADGTEVRLNAGGEILERFSVAERRVVLARGEAHFVVTKDAARPFVVSAGALRLRAIGTAFNVHLTLARTEVIVTEGKVGVERVARSADAAREVRGGVAVPSPDESPVEIQAGQRAVLATPAPAEPHRASAIVVTQVEPGEISRALAWQQALVRFGGATLAEITAEFELRTGRRVILADPALAGLRLGGRFRADDLDGFAELLATTLDIDVERAADGTLLLRKRVSNSR